MKMLIQLLLVALYAGLYSCYNHKCHLKSSPFSFRPLLMTTSESFERWCNPEFSTDQINEWFDSINKSLLTVGKSGVQDSHINSLNELLNSHERVRVKIASDKMNITETANRFMSSPLLSKSVLLDVRKTEFMVGRIK